MATAKLENTVPKVYTALAEVLKSLSVAKGGVLPGNMGGKAYITAVDASAEVKRQFVDNNLIFLPNEEVIRHENLYNNNRLQVSIVITGTYTIVSTEDASSVVISGTGDGLATGTAVASNIASTNALKNALLRAFLITEQSVEDASKNGDQGALVPAPSANQAKIDNAKKPAASSAANLNDLNTKIRGYIGDDEAKKADVNDRLGKLPGDAVAKRIALIKELGIE